MNMICNYMYKIVIYFFLRIFIDIPTLSMRSAVGNIIKYLLSSAMCMSVIYLLTCDGRCVAARVLHSNYSHHKLNVFLYSKKKSDIISHAKILTSRIFPFNRIHKI